MVEVAPTGQSNSLRVFLSYSRKDQDFVRRLADGLITKGFLPDFDQAAYDPDNVSTGISAEDEWWQRIQQMITEADAIVFVVSPDSALSKICDEEIAFARALNKRIIAILHRPIDFEKAPPRLAALNVKLNFADDARFYETLVQLSRALETDVGWIREHTRLGAIAARWERQKQPKELLLRGAELAAAETWLATRSTNAPEPAVALSTLIIESRRATTARQRAAVTASLVFVLIAVGLAAFAFWQQQIALTNEGRAIEALKDQSILVADRSLTASRRGMQLESVLLAAGVLPDERAKSPLRRSWPYTTEAHIRLLSAMTGMYSKAAFPERIYGLDGAYFGPNGKFLISTSYKGGAVIWDLQTGEVVRRLWGHGGNVNDAVFSSDGRYIATSSNDETVRVWNTETWEVEFVLEANPSGILKSFNLERVLISHDNSFVAVELPFHKIDGEEKTQHAVLIWPMKRDATPRILDYQADSIMDIDLSPDSEVLAVSTLGGSIRLIRARDGTLLRKFAHSPSTPMHSVNAVDFDPSHRSENSYRLLTAGNDYIRVWEVEKVKDLEDALGQQKLSLEMRLFMSPQAAEFSLDGQSIISATGEPSAVELWDAKTGKLKSTLLQMDGVGIGRVSLSPDGRSFVTPKLPSGPVVWSVDQTSDLRVLYSGKTPTARLSSEGKILAVTGLQGSVVVLSGPNYTTRKVLQGHSGQISSLAFDSTGDRLFSSGNGGWIIARNIKTGEQIWRKRRPNRISASTLPVGIKVGNTDRFIVSRSFAEKDLLLRDLETGEELKRFRFYPENLPNISKTSALKNQRPYEDYMAFSPDDSLIALGDNLGELQLWNVATGKRLHRLDGHEQGLNSIVFHQSKPQLLTSSNDGFAKLWDTMTGKLLREFSVDGQKIAQAVFDPSGRHVVAAIADGTIRIWDRSTGRQLNDLLGHTGAAESLAFSADGRRLATASSDGTVRIWRYSTGKHLATLQLNSFYNMRDAKFTPGGRHVIGTAAWSVVLWPDYQTIEEPLQSAVERIQSNVKRCMTPAQRKQLVLPPEPPRWCITGSGLENELDPQKWQPKWPYDNGAWRQWLVKRDAGETPPIPWRFD